MAAFGFSFGDFVDGIELVRQLINALKSGAGSSKEYQDLIHELYSLERSLLEVKHLQVDDAQRAQKIAVEQAAVRCQTTISEFLSKVSKYQPSLRAGGSGSSWRDRLRKIQWALYRKEDVQRFRAQIQGHASSIMTLLMTLQLYVSVLFIDFIGLNHPLNHVLKQLSAMQPISTPPRRVHMGQLLAIHMEISSYASTNPFATTLASCGL